MSTEPFTVDPEFDGPHYEKVDTLLQQIPSTVQQLLDVVADPTPENLRRVISGMAGDLVVSEDFAEGWSKERVVAQSLFATSATLHDAYEIIMGAEAHRMAHYGQGIPGVSPGVLRVLADIARESNS